MLQKVFRPHTTYTDWIYGRLLLSNWDVGRGWKRAPVTLPRANFLLPCTRLPMIASQDLLDSAVVEFTKSKNQPNEESIFQSILVAKQTRQAYSAMRMAEASFDCTEWQTRSGQTFRVHRVDVPFAEYDHVAYRLKEALDDGDVHVSLIVVRIGYIIVRIAHEKRGSAPSIDRTTDLMRKVIRKIMRDFPKLRDAAPRPANDSFRDHPVPEPLRFAIPESGDITLQMVLTERRSLGADQSSDPGTVDGVRMAEYQTYQSLKDLYAFEAHAMYFENDNQASAMFLDFTQGISEQFGSSSPPEPCDLPVPVDQTFAVSGTLRDGESSCRATCIAFRRGNIVCGYRSMTIDADPLLCVRSIVERILSCESVG